MKHPTRSRLSSCVFAVASVIGMSAGSVAYPASNSSSELVDAAVREHLMRHAAENGLSEPVFKLIFTTSVQNFATCQKNVVIEATETRYFSRMRFTETCPGPNGWMRTWTVKAEVSASVVVTAVDVPANKPLTVNDLALEHRRLTDWNEGVGRLDAVVGQSSTRTLQRGQLVQPRFLARPVVMKRGDSVTILARSGPIEVNMAAEAVEAGRIGDIVRVRNVNTGRVIRARVLEKGLVEPETFAPGSQGQSAD